MSLVIDSAYAEYVEENDYSDGIDSQKYNNVATTRIFSQYMVLLMNRMGIFFKGNY